MHATWLLETQHVHTSSSQIFWHRITDNQKVWRGYRCLVGTCVFVHLLWHQCWFVFLLCPRYFHALFCCTANPSLLYVHLFWRNSDGVGGVIERFGCLLVSYTWSGLILGVLCVFGQPLLSIWPNLCSTIDADYEDPKMFFPCCSSVCLIVYLYLFVASTPILLY